MWAPELIITQKTCKYYTTGANSTYACSAQVFTQKSCIDVYPPLRHATGQRGALPHQRADPGQPDDRPRAATSTSSPAGSRTGSTCGWPGRAARARPASATRCSRAARPRATTSPKVDLFRVGDAAELAETLAVQVIRNRSAAHRLVRATRKAGPRGALGGAGHGCAEAGPGAGRGRGDRAVAGAGGRGAAEGPRRGAAPARGGGEGGPQAAGALLRRVPGGGGRPEAVRRPRCA